MLTSVLPIRGTESEVAGMISATSNMNTVRDSSTVMPGTKTVDREMSRKMLSSKSGFLLNVDLSVLKINAAGCFKQLRIYFGIFFFFIFFPFPSREYSQLYVYSDLVSLNGILKQADIFRPR